MIAARHYLELLEKFYSLYSDFKNFYIHPGCVSIDIWFFFLENVSFTAMNEYVIKSILVF